MHANFRKVRVKEDKDKKLSDLDIMLNKKKNILKKKHLSTIDLKDIEDIEKEISIECEDKEFEKLQNVL